MQTAPWLLDRHPTRGMRSVALILVVIAAMLLLAVQVPGAPRDARPSSAAAPRLPAVGSDANARTEAAPLARTWTNLTGREAHSPGPLYEAVSAWDPALEGTLIFGGTTSLSVSTLTWLLQNGTFTELHPSTAPPGLAGATMAYDAADGYALLFGGEMTASPYTSAETWIFARGTWTQLTPAVSPPARFLAQMAYDSTSGTVVLFGGYAGGASFSDTWTFHAGNWTRVTGASPTGRIEGAMANDPGGSGVLLFGGLDSSSGSVLGDTWLFHAGTWTQLSPASSPSVRSYPQLVLDPVSGGVLLYGGASSAGVVTEVYSDTWLYENGTWQNLTGSLGATPPPAGGGILGADPVSGAVVLFGGITQVSRITGMPLIGFTTWVLAEPLAVGEPQATPPTGIGLVGHSVSFSSNVTGGLGGYLLVWLGLPGGCPSVNVTTIACSDLTAGSYSVRLEASDFLDSATVGPALTFVVAETLVAYAPVASRTSADVGQSVVFEGNSSGGLGSISIQWMGLPTGCPIVGLAVTCAFSAAGSYTIFFNATDPEGMAAVSPGVSVTVYADPALGVPIVRTGSLFAGVADAGATATVTANLTAPGSGGPYSYLWEGLPAGCSGRETQTVSCVLTVPGPGVVSVEVTDGNGFRVGSPAVAWFTNPPLADPSVVLGGPSEVGAATTLFAEVSGGTGPYAVLWTFADGSTAQGTAVTHVFRTTGVQTVEVSVEDATGTTRNATVNVTVASAAPGGQASATPASSLPLPWAFGIALGILLGAIGILLALAGRRRAPPSGGTGAAPPAGPGATPEPAHAPAPPSSPPGPG